MATVVESHGQLSLVIIDGALNEDSVGQFRETLEEHLKGGARWFILDFSKAHSIDSKGIEAILWFLDSVEADAGKAKAAELDKNLLKIFEMTGLNRRIELFDSIHEAVKSFS